jgi:hypothetical protein
MEWKIPLIPLLSLNVGSIDFLKLLLQNIVVLFIFFEFIFFLSKNCPYLETTDFSIKTKKYFFFLLNPL